MRAMIILLLGSLVLSTVANAQSRDDSTNRTTANKATGQPMGSTPSHLLYNLSPEEAARVRQALREASERSVKEQRVVSGRVRDLDTRIVVTPGREVTYVRQGGVYTNRDTSFAARTRVSRDPQTGRRVLNLRDAQPDASAVVLERTDTCIPFRVEMSVSGERGRWNNMYCRTDHHTPKRQQPNTRTRSVFFR